MIWDIVDKRDETIGITDFDNKIPWPRPVPSLQTMV